MREDADLVLATNYVPTMESLCMQEMGWAVMQHPAQLALDLAVQGVRQA